MISKLGQVMIYVNDQDESVKFWTEQVGFVVVSEADNGQGMKWIEIAPSLQAGTSLVLHNKALVAEMQPDMNLGTPSLMFFASELEQLYTSFKEKGITVGDLVTMPGGKVFNFADKENNYFAIMEQQ
ncbi:MAG: VOC family protein [Candidatus Pristimantibacillus lignocellulolyticus]|uniref:VOC family protein n=1 Tax=Candidatus Pristimantibacillus lignocellulolyticus TaxID=2994561 RepID=A0A9J6ZHS2_9BACL|nr:MAG: VOC family protein [Candidatus Pristimantibacillus lignocellulolyticus]